MRVLLLSLFVAMGAHAQSNPDQPVEVSGNAAKITLSAGFGASQPEPKPDYVDGRVPSRSVGGETIAIRFRQAKAISLLRLTALSKSGRGKILVREVKVGETRINELEKMIEAKYSVDTNPVLTAETISLTIEGYSDNDTTLIVEVESTDGFVNDDIAISRAGSARMGGYFDEKDYANFTPGDLTSLMKAGTNPVIADFTAKTWVCSVYTYQNSRDIDYKTRRYFELNPGVLQSTTDLSGDPATWILTQEGWKLPLPAFDMNCGKINYAQIIRKTAGGNLVAESVINKGEVTRACASKGIPMGTFFRDHTLPSQVNDDKYAVIAQEFCRPADLP